MSCKVRVFTANGEITLDAEIGKSVHEILTDAGIFIDAPCGGRAECGKCVVLASGALSKENELELELLSGRQGRLACIARVLGDCDITLPGGAEGVSVSTEGVATEFTFEPWGRVPGLGAAIDIGTTTVVCYLYDLRTGARLGTAGELNLQRSFGADVISRIAHCIKKPDGREELTGVILKQIRDMLKRLAEKAGASSTDITALCVAANTTMAHLFAGLSPEGLAAVPFVPESLFGEGFAPDLCRELGIAPGAEVFILPAVSGFVGGDITGAALAAGLGQNRQNALLLDIGTNGEIVLEYGGGMLCCATAAGPAFEGAGIFCGMGGAAGAISSVYLSGGEIAYKVIGDTAPKGICGSGLVDALCLMLAVGALDETGRLLRPGEAGDAAKPYLTETDSGEAAFKITGNIYITGRDVRALQLAKAAIAAGVHTLLDEAGLKVEDVQKMYIAGGFGGHIDSASAAEIGLYPKQLAGRCVSVGNAAGMGAAAVLCSAEARRAVSALRDKMRYIELSSDKRFMAHYVEQMMF
jgi:uncharacterized 2Fe-2S/4Fe-4S cluster protein (DUF4445 family)